MYFGGVLIFPPALRLMRDGSPVLEHSLADDPLETEGLRRNQRRVIYGVLILLDPSLTLTRMQYPAIVGNTGNRKTRYLCGICKPLQRPETPDRALVMRSAV
jgi:hypothetical protein